MPETITESGAWSLDQVHMLSELAREKVPARLIAMKMRRSEADLHAKAAEIGITLARD